MYRRNHGNRTHRKYCEPNFTRERPVWPLPALDGRLPIVLSATGSLELVLAYEEQGERFVPDRTPVLAIKCGVIMSSYESDVGGVISIDHRNGFSSTYAGLHDPIVKPASWCRKLVKTGEAIGYISSPRRTALRPLRVSVFKEITRGLPGFPFRIDPLIVLEGRDLVHIDRSSGVRTGEAA